MINFYMIYSISLCIFFINIKLKTIRLVNTKDLE